MKVLFSLIASAVAIGLYMPAEASRGMPADIETLDRLWQKYNASCEQEQQSCELRDEYQRIIKQNFPNAVPAYCPPGIKRVWFETGRNGMRIGCKMFWLPLQTKINYLRSIHENSNQIIYIPFFCIGNTAKCSVSRANVQSPWSEWHLCQPTLSS